MVFDKLKRSLVKKFITDKDVTDSQVYQDFLNEYKKTHIAVREFLRKYRDFEPPTSYKDINLISDGPALREEMAQLERLITGKDNLILLEKSKIKKLEKDIQTIEEHYREYIPQEILYAVFLHVHEPMIALDADFNILEFAQETAEYFESDIKRFMPYYELFADMADFNEYKSRALELTKDDGYFRMKIQFKDRDKVSTRTEPAYSEESDSNGYITTLETEGKLKALLKYVREKMPLPKEKPKRAMNPKQITQN